MTSSLQILALCSLLSYAVAVVSDVGCGKTKWCHTFPPQCSITSDVGCRFVSWKIKPESASIELELSSGNFSGSSTEYPYIAIAFGLEHEMEDADAYYCSKDELKSASIIEEYAEPSHLPLENGMSSDQIASVDGKIQCRFTRPIAVTKAIRNNPTYNFDLSSENYFLLIAEGPLTEDGFLQYHNWRDITPAKLNFSVPLPTVQISTTVVEATTMPQNKTIDASLPSTPVPEPTSKNTNAHVVTGSTPEPGSVVPEPTAEPTTQPTTTSGSCHLHFNTWLLILAASVLFAV